MSYKQAPKEYIVQSSWGILFMRYLGVNPKVYGSEISHKEFMKLTKSSQLELIEAQENV